MDGQVVRRDPKIAGLLDKFVCVRVVKANEMDLALFQFDYDLTFAAFMMNKDKTIYGRYGSRSDQKDSMRNMSLEGFGKTLEAALELHKNYPANKAALAGKAPLPPRFPAPEKYPSLKNRVTPSLQDPQIRKNCMHCHQIHDAERNFLRAGKQPIPDEALYLYPLPDWLGLSFDPGELATVKSVAPGSSAEKDGFKSGDALLALNGQAIISLADIQWMLQNSKESATLKAQISRAGKNQDLSLTLAPGWRAKKGEFAWRTSSWSIRQWAGGMLSEDADTATRNKLGLDAAAMAMNVKHVGQYAPHNVAQKAGLKKDDVITAFDGVKTRMTESELLAYIAQKKKPGDTIELTVTRAGQPQKLQWTLPAPKD